MIYSNESLMKRAVALARNGLGTTAPNPAVGAVVVKDGRIVGKGYHKKAGEAHGEVVALDSAGKLAEGGTIYITLEPCNHHGKTPPCVEKILEAGIKKVFVGTVDPNPKVLGGGIYRLKSSQLEVEESICHELSSELIAPFKKAIEQQLPFITLKLAVTTDGKITTGRPSERWLSSSASKAFVKRLRSRSDGILVGKNTVVKDDPLLTNRLGRGSKPIRIFLDSNGEIAKLGNLGNYDAETICLTASDGKLPNIETIHCLREKHGRIDLKNALTQLYLRGLRNILCEGGAILSESLIEANLVDRLIVIECPIVSSPGAVGLNLDLLQKFSLNHSRRSGVDTIKYYKPVR
jgi:diaminohydroxyphosphoribosylaminopyrimidine deaminase/5-amino-6-(5-phosphoribosylamino)uracil reductase